MGTNDCGNVTVPKSKIKFAKISGNAPNSCTTHTVGDKNNEKS